MTAVEVYELTSQGGATDFAEVVKVCRALGPYCEPIYTMDADLVLVAAHLPELPHRLTEAGFKVERFPHSINAQRGQSQLRIQFTTNSRNQAFPARASLRTVLDQPVPSLPWKSCFKASCGLGPTHLAEAFAALRPGLPNGLRELLP